MTQPNPSDLTPSSPFGAAPRTSATNWLIGINVAVYFLDLISRGSLTRLGNFSINTAIYHLQIWRFVTFQFLHANPMHILINMFVLYFFGPLLEGPLGKKRYVIFYLLCGCSGAALFLLMGFFGLLDIVPLAGLVGASAGIYGIMVADAVLMPRMRVRLLAFFVIPISMTMRTMVLILLGLAAAAILTPYAANAGGEVAHLGGAVMGFALIHLWKRVGVKRDRHRFWRPGDDNFLRDEFRQ